MKISSFYKQAIRTVKFSLVALICGLALNFGTATSSLASQLQPAPTPTLAIFGWGEKAQGKADQLIGKSQVKIGNKLEGTSKQISGRAKYDIGRVEAASQRTANKVDKMAKDIKKGTDKNLSKAGDSIKDTANNLVDSAKKIINN